MKYIVEAKINGINTYAEYNERIIFFDYKLEAQNYIKNNFENAVTIPIEERKIYHSKYIHYKELLSLIDIKNNTTIVKDEKLFNTILSYVDMSYEIRDNKIVLKNSDGTDFTTHDGEVMYFENPTDALNSIDWLFEKEGESMKYIIEIEIGDIKFPLCYDERIIFFNDKYKAREYQEHITRFSKKCEYVHVVPIEITDKNKFVYLMDVHSSLIDIISYSMNKGGIKNE